MLHHLADHRLPSRRRRYGLRLRLAALCLAGAATACQQPAGPEGEQRPPAPTDRARAIALLTQHQCGACHVIPDVPGAAGRTGPTLAHFGQRSYIAGSVPNTPALLQRWLLDPPALVPGTTMPAMGVSPEAAREMAAYLLARP